MSVQTTPRLVGPQEASAIVEELGYELAGDSLGNITRLMLVVGARDLAHTVSTEPDRIRAAVVRALRNVEANRHWAEIREFAEAIENGADW